MTKKIALLLGLALAASPSCSLKQKNNATNDAARSNVPLVGTSVPNKYQVTNEDSPKNKTQDSSLIPRGIDFSKTPMKIAFGSCSNQDAPLPIWTQIIATEPDLFLALGDNVYASHPDQKPISEQYKKLSRIPEYRKAREEIAFMATWDDHDYGTNDGGADAPTKSTARKEFLNHYSYVRDSIPVGRDGVYHSKIIGGSTTGTRRKRVTSPTVQVIMLDTRSFRSPLKKAAEPTPLRKYEAEKDTSTTILGEDQWVWLESELKRTSRVKVIVSSIQLIATEHGFEKWSNFPHERERFFNLLRKTNAKNVIVLSGDRHMATIAKTTIKGWGTLYDITSSALNVPSNLEENDKDYLQPAYSKENFGLLTFDFNRKKALVEIRDLSNQVVQKVEIPIQ